MAKATATKEQKAAAAVSQSQLKARRRAAKDPVFLEQKRIERAWTIEKLKQDVLTGYGAQCSCCGIEEFLTLDHVGGRDEEYKKEKSYAAWRRARREGFPDHFRILCWNCNASHGLYGYCPHDGVGEA